MAHHSVLSVYSHVYKYIPAYSALNSYNKKRIKEPISIVSKTIHQCIHYGNQVELHTNINILLHNRPCTFPEYTLKRNEVKCTKRYMQCLLQDF